MLGIVIDDLTVESVTGLIYVEMSVNDTAGFGFLRSKLSNGIRKLKTAFK